MWRTEASGAINEGLCDCHSQICDRPMFSFFLNFDVFDSLNAHLFMIDVLVFSV